MHCKTPPLLWPLLATVALGGGCLEAERYEPTYSYPDNPIWCGPLTVSSAPWVGDFSLEGAEEGEQTVDACAFVQFGNELLNPPTVTRDPLAPFPGARRVRYLLHVGKEPDNPDMVCDLVGTAFGLEPYSVELHPWLSHCEWRGFVDASDSDGPGQFFLGRAEMSGRLRLDAPYDPIPRDRAAETPSFELEATGVSNAFHIDTPAVALEDWFFASSHRAVVMRVEHQTTAAPSTIEPPAFRPGQECSDVDGCWVATMGIGHVRTDRRDLGGGSECVERALSMVGDELQFFVSEGGLKARERRSWYDFAQIPGNGCTFFGTPQKQEERDVVQWGATVDYDTGRVWMASAERYEGPGPFATCEILWEAELRPCE